MAKACYKVVRFYETIQIFFFLVLAVLNVTASCSKDNLNTGGKLNGYWYLSSYQRILTSAGGAVLQSFDMAFTESDMPLSATFVLVYAKTEKTYFESWYKGDY